MVNKYVTIRNFPDPSNIYDSCGHRSQTWQACADSNETDGGDSSFESDGTPESLSQVTDYCSHKSDENDGHDEGSPTVPVACNTVQWGEKMHWQISSLGDQKWRKHPSAKGNPVKVNPKASFG